MNYPKSVIINEEEWRIRFVDAVCVEDNLLGECDPAERLIKIRKGQTPKETLQTFIHELLHALAAEYGFKLKHKHIVPLEYSVYRLLKENGWIGNWAAPVNPEEHKNS